MHDVAEKGVAAHWSYKDSDKEKPDVNSIEPFNWLQDMVGQLVTGHSAEEFLENTKLELFTDQVFCFTPKGRLIALPRGATALDFAYAVHTQVGNSCVGVRINGLKLPTRTMLKNGDEIEIIRGDNQMPSENWLHYVSTGKARAAIRHALRDREEADYLRLGEEMVRNLFAAEELDVTSDLLERALGVLGIETLKDLHVGVGRGDFAAVDVLLAVMPKKRARRRDRFAGAMRGLIGRGKTALVGEQVIMPLRGELFGTAVTIAEDCFPLPGDRIVGILTRGKGIVVYPAEAPALAAYEDKPERWVSMRWEDNNLLFASRLNLTVVNRTGSLSTITQTIADFDANITNLRLTQNNDDFCDLSVDVEVRDRDHMRKLVAAIRGSRVVSKANRVIYDG